MCLCCCNTRKSILIFAITISTLAFIYGIVALAEFGFNTDIYEYLIKKIDNIEEGGTDSSQLNFPNINLGNYPSYYSEYSQNSASLSTLDQYQN